MAQERDGVFTWIHADHLSSATRITDSAGLEIRRLAYAAFGEEAENQGSGDEPKYKYTGKEQDSTGLYYYGARYYDPALSRFITADTVYDVGPQGLNRYSYALNNPILYRDPTGHYIDADLDDGGYDDGPVAKGNVTGSQEQFKKENGTVTVHNYYGTHPLAYWQGLAGGPEPNASVGEIASGLVSAGLLANPGGMAYMAIMALTYPYQQTAAQYYRETGHPIMEWIAENPDLAIAGVAASGAVARVISMKLGVPQAIKALKGRLGLGGSPAMNTTGGIWKRLRRGTRIRRSGNVWIKEVDPDASAFWRWWGRGELKAQAKGLKRLGDMAPEFSYTNGRLTIPHLEPFQGSSFEAWKVSLKAKWRLRTVFDDAQIRNIGAGGLVFDPISHPVARKILWIGSIITGGALGSLPAIQSEMKK